MSGPSNQQLERERILGALSTGLSVRKVAQHLGIHPSRVWRVKKRGVADRQGGSGRPSILSPRAKIIITKNNKETLHASVRKTAKRLAEEGEPCSPSTVSRYIQKQEWSFPYKPQFYPCLSAKNIADRMEFVAVMEAEGWLRPRVGKNLLKFVMFTDESPIPLFAQPNKQNHRYRTADPNKARCLPKTKGAGLKVQVAAGLCHQGLTDLYILPEGKTWTSALYTSEVLPHYVNECKRMYGDVWESVKLQEDGATCHSAKASQNWVRENWPGDVLLRKNDKFFWPGNSPDLNPIEPLWAVLQDCVWESPRPTTRSGLITRAKQVWLRMHNSGEWRPHLESFGNRIRAVQEVQGRNTKY